ncbi:MAG: VWA domain-containing protein [Bacteroidota bacterium]
MKKLIHVPRFLFLLGLLALASCKKENVEPADLSKFYRLKSFEVGVIPEHRQVRILFQVTDYYRKGVATLTKDDFIVSENKGRIDTEADIRLSRDSIPFDIKTVLLLDVSRSVEGLVPQLKTAAKALIQKKLPEQEIAIYTFDADTKKVKDFSADQSALLAAIESIPEHGLVNSTNLYGAVMEVADLWEDEYSLDGITDGSLIIFTDGRHNATQALTLASAKNALGDRRAYVAALASVDLDEVALKELAGEEDRYFKADDVAGLEQMFLDIQTEIQSLSKSIYFLYYTSPISDPSPFENELTIEVKGNINNGFDRRILEMFNSEGFGN